MKTLLTIYLLSLSCLTTRADLDEQLDAELLDLTANAITIIFDDSGSMGERDKLPQAKLAFGEWLKGQSDETRFSLIHFAKDGRIAIPLEKNNREKVRSFVENLAPLGRTPIARCLKLASRQIKARQAEYGDTERHIIVVFTDGAETLDRRGNAGVVEEVEALTRSGIEVVGIGFHGEGDYLSSAVTTFYTADSAEELRKGLEKISAEVDTTVEFELSAEEEELMKTVSLEEPETAETTSHEVPPPNSHPSGNSSSNPPSSSSSFPAEKKTSPFSFILFLIIAVIVVRVILKIAD